MRVDGDKISDKDNKIWKYMRVRVTYATMEVVGRCMKAYSSRASGTVVKKKESALHHHDDPSRSGLGQGTREAVIARYEGHTGAQHTRHSCPLREGGWGGPLTRCSFSKFRMTDTCALRLTQLLRPRVSQVSTTEGYLKVTSSRESQCLSITCNTLVMSSCRHSLAFTKQSLFLYRTT